MNESTPLHTPAAVPILYQQPQHRDAEITEFDPDEGTLLCRAAPYDQETQLDVRLWESFARGTFAAAANAPGRVKMWHEHTGPLIGHAKVVEDRSDGIWVRARFSNTMAAQEARELANDGTLDQVSVTFRPMTDWMQVRRRADGLHVLHKRAHLLGFALVAHGAYNTGAFVASVRDAESKKQREAIKARLLSLNH